MLAKYSYASINVSMAKKKVPNRSAGGKARAANLTEDVRREIARRAAEARWKDKGIQKGEVTMAKDGQLMLNLQLIPREVEGALVPQRVSDGFVNATSMCQAVGKLFGHYRALKSTTEFLEELSSDIGIPISGLVLSIKGGSPYEQGTWVHPDVAINLGQWCSPKFAVAVARWVREWMAGKVKINQVELPYHLRRYMANRHEIPHTHWSMLNELTFGIVAPLEDQGYQLPDDLVPDISMGLMFSGWLRKVKNIEPGDFPTYKHRYEDGRVVDARLYPNELLPDFRKHLHEVWIPQKMIGYFKKRDPEALPFIEKTNLLTGGAAHTLSLGFEP